MNTKIKFGLGLVAVIAIVGAYFFPTLQAGLGASDTGSTFSTQKTAAIVWTPSTGATTTSIQNTDANDRYVTSSHIYCGTVGTSLTPLTGTGLAAVLIKAATTSTAAPAIVTNANLTMSVTLATSSVDSIVSTSTFGTAYWQRWAAGSYMSFYSNATNTAVCTVGVNYVPS